MSRGMIGLGLWIVTLAYSMNVWAEPQVNLGNIPAGKTVTVTYDVMVNDDASGNQLSSQAMVSGANFTSIVTDDPATVTADDATVTAIDSADTSVGLSATDTSPTSSENVTFTAQVTTSDPSLETPTGNVEFLIDGITETTVAVNASGEASFNKAFSVGNYTVIANYLGNAEFASATTNSNITAVAASTTTAIDSYSSSSIYPGDSVTFNFSVSIEAVANGLPIVGTVEVSSGSETCSADVSIGSCSIQFNSTGTRSLTATYTSSSPEVNGSVSSSVNVEVVNNPPAINPISSQVVTSLQELTFVVVANDPDPSAVISYSLVPGAPAGSSINSTTGEFSWIPTEAQGGSTYSVSIVASDQFGATDNIAVSITVIELDNPPVLNNDIVSTVEDTPVSFNPFDNDIEDNTFDYSTIVIVSEPVSGSVTVSLVTGQMTYTPSENFNGADQIQYQVKDDAGNDSNIGAINVTIDAVNDLPVLEPIGSKTVLSLDTLTFTAKATDVDTGSSLAYSLSGQPAGATINSGSGLFSWTPTEEQGGGDYQLTVTVTDNEGGTDAEIINVAVTALDNAPVLNDDFIITEEDMLGTFNPLDNDDEDNSFDLSSLEIVTEPSSGLLQVDTSTGEMTYTPNQNYNGSDLAQYQIKDDAGNLSNIANINFTVNSVNDLPVITSNPTLTVVESQTYLYDIEATDVDGQPLQISAISLTSWLQLVGNQVTGVPTQDDIGSHDVIVEVSDGVDKVQQSFTIAVVSANSNDVSISQEASTVAPLISESFEILYSIYSGGPDQARDTSLAIELTGEVEISVSDSRCVVNLNTVNCSLGTIEANQTEDVSISLTKYDIGDVYSYARIESADDPLLDNNDTGLGVSITEELMSEKGATVGEAVSQVVITGDINNDGLDDIVLLRGANAIGSSFINDGAGNFNKGFDIQGEEIAVAAKLAHINDDSHLDLVVATAQNQPTLVYLGDGAGNFTIGQLLGVANSNALDIEDLNGDDLADVIIANNGPDEVYLNHGIDLQLSHVIDSVNSTTLALTDVDGDGLLDGVFAVEDGTSRFYRNDQLLDVLSPPNNFTSIATGLVSSIISLDVNNDGVNEVIFAGAIDQQDRQQIPANKIYGWDSGFNLLQSIGRMDSAQVLVSDIEGDGDTDLFVMNKLGAHQIYLNEAGVYELASKLLLNEAATSASWVAQSEDSLKDLILAEDLIEGSALYINQGDGEFGQAIADLSVETVASATSVNEQGVVTIQIIVQNNGPSVAQSVELQATTNSNVNIVAFGSGVEGCTIDQGSMTCSLDNLRADEARQIPLRVIAVGVGQATVATSVNTQSLDPMLNNNQAQVNLTINPKRDINSGGGHTGLWLLILLGLMLGRRRNS